MTAKIHLIERENNIWLINKEHAEWESGWWVVAPNTAEQLIGGHIYFHKTQAKPSFFGGTIISYRIEAEGEWSGRVVFKFCAGPEFKDVKAGSTGWGMEKKVVL
ncbi:MAG: hypothetical protein JSR64_12085 [Nitrospira sp.]|nr:hypothetical protein [Nitrospira sp.]